MLRPDRKGLISPAILKYAKIGRMHMCGIIYLVNCTILSARKEKRMGVIMITQEAAIAFN